MKRLILLGTLLLLQASGYGQLQNTSFENWENPINNSPGGNRPLSWIRTNGVAGSENYNFYHDPVAIAQDGNYALRLSIWYTYDKDMARQVAPISYRPTALTGFYTYTNNQVLDGLSNDIIDDVAKATVRLTKADPATGTPVLIGLGVVPLGASSIFAPFTCIINYVSDQTPDTIEVIFDCSVLDKNGGATVTAPPGSGVSSILTIDNIALMSQDLSADAFSLKNIKVYPNPATDVVHIQNFQGHARIYDVSGKLVAKHFTQTGTIEIGGLEQGVYVLSLANSDGTFTSKLIKR